MSVNSKKKTPAVAGGLGHGGRGRGGRGRSKELPILDHAVVGEDVVETPTRIPSALMYYRFERLMLIPYRRCLPR